MAAVVLIIYNVYNRLTGDGERQPLTPPQVSEKGEPVDVIRRQEGACVGVCVGGV